MLDNYYANYLRMKIRRARRILSIPRHWLVLDVGSGNAPFPRADVICDKLAEDTERVAELSIDRPFVMGDITSLPFADGSFDFAHCSHMLEHVNDPATAMKELMRVARRGYIECPTEFQEKTRSTGSHKWFVSLKDGTLIFRKKDKKIFDEYLHDICSRLWETGDKSYMNFFYRHHHDLFSIEYQWEKDINFRIEGDTYPSEAMPEELEKIACGLKKASGQRRTNIRNHLKNLMAILAGAKTRNTKEIIGILSCTHCRGKIESISEDTLRCRNCGRSYPVCGGSPIMLRYADIKK